SSCFMALGIGIGLDYGIHLAFGHHDGEGEEGAVQHRVLTNVLVVGIGLSVLLFSSNPTIARLGLLIVLSMAASGYTAIAPVPRPPPPSGERRGRAAWRSAPRAPPPPPPPIWFPSRRNPPPLTGV